MHINDFELFIDDVILARGKSYYVNGHIENITALDEFMYEANEEGTETYHLQVTLDENKEILLSSCDCPYDFSLYCKHQVAIFYALKDFFRYEKILPDGASTEAAIGIAKEASLS